MTVLAVLAVLAVRVRLVRRLALALVRLVLPALSDPRIQPMTSLAWLFPVPVRIWPRWERPWRGQIRVGAVSGCGRSHLVSIRDLR